jgi:hypothetical protein
MIMRSRPSETDSEAGATNMNPKGRVHGAPQTMKLRAPSKKISLSETVHRFVLSYMALSPLETGMQLKRLKQKLAELDKGETIYTAVLLDLLRTMRIVMEEQHNGGKYPMLSLYCTWLQHAKLDRNNHGYKLLDTIGRAISDSPSSVSHSDHISKILSSFGLTELREQMRQFLQANGLSSALIDSFQNWSALLRALYVELSGVQLEFPEAVVASLMPGFDKSLLSKADQKAMPIRLKIEDRHKAAGMYPNFVINRFCVDEMNESDDRRSEGEFLWKVEMGPQNRVQLDGAITFPEPRTAFLRA